MKGKTDFLLGDKGMKLHYRYWLPKDPQKVLAIVHGLGEHGGRYAHVSEHFAEAGFAVYALDLRGHGKSKGKRGHTTSYQALLNDIEEFLKTIRSHYTDLPIILYGHSMGGNLVANYMLRMNTNELAGYALSAPYFQLAFEPPAWKVKLADILGSLLPSLSQPNGLNIQHLSKLPEEVAKYKNDPLVHPHITVRLYNETARAARFALESDKIIELPGYILHGGADRIIAPEGSAAFAAKQTNAIRVVYLKAYHEPHNDEESAEVIQNLIEWAKK